MNPLVRAFAIEQGQDLCAWLLLLDREKLLCGLADLGAIDEAAGQLLELRHEFRLGHRPSRRSPCLFDAVLDGLAGPQPDFHLDRPVVRIVLVHAFSRDDLHSGDQVVQGGIPQVPSRVLLPGQLPI